MKKYFKDFVFTLLGLSFILYGVYSGIQEARRERVIEQQSRQLNKMDMERMQALDEIMKLQEELNNKTEEKCLEGRAIVLTEYGYFDIGNVQFCGQNTHWTSIYGPDMEVIIENKEKENAELYNKTVRLEEEIERLKEQKNK